jgi:phenylpropionate dioxygenase-like ring-hydroxylating dioxygenase large terminal subunit
MFQNDGSVNAIPRKPRFCDVSAADLEELRLQSVPLATWGCLIFVQLEPAGIPWEDFIAPIKERLEPIIQSIGPRKQRLQQKVSANWKSLIENSVEAYHLDCVHGDTFAKLGLGTIEMHVPAPHCLGVTRVAEETMKRWQRVDGLLSSRIHKTEAYEHAIVFPNCGIGSLYGATVAIEQYLPLSATETLYTADIFACQLGELSAEQQALADAFFESSCGFAAAIFEEDMRIVQIQQAGLRSSQSRGRLSEDERLIWFLQKQWQCYPALVQI